VRKIHGEDVGDDIGVLSRVDFCEVLDFDEDRVVCAVRAKGLCRSWWAKGW
jgi:hypothetical protein